MWNENFTFDVQSGREQLSIEVWDKDDFGSDDYLGGNVVPSLDDYMDQTQKDIWINLFPKGATQEQQ